MFFCPKLPWDRVWPNSHRVAESSIAWRMAGRTYFAGLGAEQIQPLLSEEERPVNGTMVLLNPMVLLKPYAGRSTNTNALGNLQQIRPQPTSGQGLNEERGAAEGIFGGPSEPSFAT